MEVTMPTKEQCAADSARICEYLMVDFETKLKTHKEKEHKWFIQGSIHGICRDLGIDKQLAIYLVLGSNTKEESWGNLREKTEVEPVKYIMRRTVVDKGREIFPDHGFKVYFGDNGGKGDFHMKVDFYLHAKKADDDSTEFVKVEKREYKPRTKKEFVPKNKSSKPSEDAPKSKTYASAIKTVKDEDAPAPVVVTSKPVVKTQPTKTAVYDITVIEKLMSEQKAISEQLAKLTSLLADKISA